MQSSTHWLNQPSTKYELNSPGYICRFLNQQHLRFCQQITQLWSVPSQCWAKLNPTGWVNVPLKPMHPCPCPDPSSGVPLPIVRVICIQLCQDIVSYFILTSDDNYYLCVVQPNISKCQINLVTSLVITHGKIHHFRYVMLQVRLTQNYFARDSESVPLYVIMLPWY